MEKATSNLMVIYQLDSQLPIPIAYNSIIGKL